MIKKVILALALSVLTVGVVFSQTETAEETNESDQIVQTEQTTHAEQPKQATRTDFAGMAKNTVTVDIGPTIIGLSIGMAGELLGGSTGLSSGGFGIGAQYERNLSQKFSAALRFAYLGGSLGFSYNDSYEDTTKVPGTSITVPYKATIGLDISSFSIEGHARYYPWGKTFFLDGMLGYAQMMAGSSFKIDGQDETGTVVINDSVKVDVSQGFFKLGAKIGWRISLGKNGGFTFEPALGYSFGIGFGDTVWDQLSSQVSKKIKDNNPDVDMEKVNGFNEGGKVFGYIQDFIFIGGPRLTLAFGWRF